MPSYATMKAKKPPMWPVEPVEAAADGVLRAKGGLGTAYLLRLVPKTKQLRNLESMFTVSEWLVRLLSAASIDSPAARSALGKI